MGKKMGQALVAFVVALAAALALSPQSAASAHFACAPSTVSTPQGMQTAADPPISRIVVVPVNSSAANLVPGVKAQFLATAYTSGGAAVLGISFAWAATPPAFCSLDATTGAFVNVTAKTYGAGTLTAGHLGAVGSIAIAAPAPDSAAPAVWHEPPFSQTSNHSVLIAAKVTDSSAMKSVTVRYRAGAGAFLSAQMAPQKADPEEYRVVLQLPKSFRGTLEYYIEAQDAYGNAATAPQGNGTARFSIEITTEPALYEQPGFWFALLAVGALASSVGILAARQRRRAGKKRPKMGAAMGPGRMPGPAPKKASDENGPGNKAADAQIRAKKSGPAEGAKGKQ